MQRNPASPLAFLPMTVLRCDAMKKLRAGAPLRTPTDLATHTLLPGLLRARVAAGLSQRSLADRLKVSRSSIATWEAQLGRAPRSIVPALARTLRVKADALIP